MEAVQFTVHIEEVSGMELWASKKTVCLQWSKSH